MLSPITPIPIRQIERREKRSEVLKESVFASRLEVVIYAREKPIMKSDLRKNFIPETFFLFVLK